MSENLKEVVLDNVSLDNLPQVADQIVEFAGPQKVWTFDGEMGAGKTTLIKHICKVLRASETVSSPTFSIVNEYQTLTKSTINHFDFYRINNEREAYDIGCEEYFYSGDYCFIEWPTKIKSLLPTARLEVAIAIRNNTIRDITLTQLGLY